MNVIASEQRERGNPVHCWLNPDSLNTTAQSNIILYMKKILFFLFFLLSFQSFALEDVGIAKYAVLEVNKDNTPLRTLDNEDAARATHLYKNTVLFADKQNKNYYRVELNKNNFLWVNKKNVEVQGIIPEKRFSNIEKISFSENKKAHLIEIKTKTQSAYLFKEDNNNLNFTLFDNYFDPIETRVSNKSTAFKLEEKLNSELNLKYINDKPLFGYDIISSDKGYLITIKKTPKINKRHPLKNIKVVVDAGHGGSEKGACAFNLEEKNINLEISKKLSKELRKRGAKVYLTRKKDVKMPLYDRVDFAKQKDADILLSIHQNSLPNPKDVYKKHGVGTYYYYPEAFKLAQFIQKNLVADTGFRDDKVNHRSFALNRNTAQLSVLIECGYLIKEEEAMKLSDKNFQKIVAKAIAKGCEEFLRKSYI